MRYGQRGGYTPAEQERRERVRLQAAEWFKAGESTRAIAVRLRVHERSVTRWRKAWREGGGAEALLSKGPVSREKLSAAQWARLDAELKRGPLAWGHVEDQCWTLGRVKTLIGRLFHIGYTIEGVGKLLHRHGWSVQVPARRAMERDEEAVALWKAEVWPAAKPPRRTWVPTSASKTRPGRD
ncbi:winged helix-turn-helix domain-containing protein [Actinomadura sp. ATCC 31491]|uniref:Winged helix-turn-helix domain-containing protein n=1 Tax=Actinomadura luzonensis TaxID=2805427 RepID=A0ABT0FLZ0_9ACTN|nr:winged helix-turn-helix domain-containing protein [Actinomadura luzonensis]MCK2213356.1 winged helix-turn-helix domain-containing protein [Actinomadura luzonensis]MCK2213366.1 winged helix-turn-helix domain-containing protein [Actinomadura luzonensis]MCK2214336.1 winged helix-turn-helix domain-containing protein [Actinomadura luzonensis]